MVIAYTGVGAADAVPVSSPMSHIATNFGGAARAWLHHSFFAAELPACLISCLVLRQIAPMAASKRPRGRPPSPQGAKPRAEVQRAYRERRKAAGKTVVTIDTWTTPTPAEIAELRERLRNALLQLELRQQDVARLEQRAASADAELRRVEQHNLNLVKDVIVLKKQLADRPERRGRHAKASDKR
jgi:hypothetical protein